VSGRTQHVVSVMPKRVSSPIGLSIAEFDWRAVCTCGQKSMRGLGRAEAERWAVGHAQIVDGSVRLSASECWPKAPQVATDSGDSETGGQNVDSE
jgi:hypothetical protein